MNRLWLLPALALGGCADPHLPLAPDYGNAVATNMAAQIINPAPNTTYREPVTNGERMTDAMDRYRTGKVYPPLPPIAPVVQEGAAPPPPPPFAMPPTQ